MTSRDKAYEDGYRLGITGSPAMINSRNVSKDGKEGYEDGHADYGLIRGEGSIEEQLRQTMIGGTKKK